MISKTRRKLQRKLKRTLRQPRTRRIIAVVLLCTICLGYAVYMDTRRLTVDPASYRPLLDVIAGVESKGNYDAYFGNPANTSVKFTDMTIAEVQAWQTQHIASGHASSAVGRYQIIDSTLAGLIHRQHIDTSRKFDQALQDQLAIALLVQRGSEKLINKELTREQFAANLAKEWAALPRVVGDDPEASYYDGDGLNSSLVPSRTVLDAVGKISAR